MGENHHDALWTRMYRSHCAAGVTLNNDGSACTSTDTSYALFGREIHQRLGRFVSRDANVCLMDKSTPHSQLSSREGACEGYRPHPEELAKQASRRMDATQGLAA